LSATFFGQPRGLATLFLTEMWERFTFYGMRALLVLFLVSSITAGGFALDDKTATAIYGLYNAAVYLAALPGGWIADRLIGAQRAVMLGGLLITLGNALLAISSTPRGFYIGLVVIVLGVGLLKPNVSAIVADLYPEGGARLDAGFTIFYIGINIGGFLGPLVTGEAQSLWGQRAGFGAAAFFMAVGVLQFYLTKRHLGSSGAYIPPSGPAVAARTKQWRQLWVAIAAAALLLALVSFGFIPVSAVNVAQAVTYAIVAMAVLYFLYYFFIADINREERRRGVVLVVLFIGCALFFSGFEQAGSSLNLFAERYTNRHWFGQEIPASWLQSLNPIYIVLFGPVFSLLWVRLARRGLDPSTPLKFLLAMLGMAAGFLVMAAAARLVVSGHQVGMGWLAATYLLHTWAELALSPVGMSATTRLVPARFVGQGLGLWFVSLALGNLLASRIAGNFDPAHPEALPGEFMQIVRFGAVCAAGLAISLPFMRRWMRGAS
jgi:proton-dependent oligopeptide transporter, POT family